MTCDNAELGEKVIVQIKLSRKCCDTFAASFDSTQWFKLLAGMLPVDTAVALLSAFITAPPRSRESLAVLCAWYCRFDDEDTASLIYLHSQPSILLEIFCSLPNHDFHPVLDACCAASFACISEVNDDMAERVCARCVSILSRAPENSCAVHMALLAACRSAHAYTPPPALSEQLVTACIQTAQRHALCPEIVQCATKTLEAICMYSSHAQTVDPRQVIDHVCAMLSLVKTSAPALTALVCSLAFVFCCFPRQAFSSRPLIQAVEQACYGTLLFSYDGAAAIAKTAMCDLVRSISLQVRCTEDKQALSGNGDRITHALLDLIENEDGYFNNRNARVVQSACSALEMLLVSCTGNTEPRTANRVNRVMAALIHSVGNSRHEQMSARKCLAKLQATAVTM